MQYRSKSLRRLITRLSGVFHRGHTPTLHVAQPRPTLSNPAKLSPPLTLNPVRQLHADALHIAAHGHKIRLTPQATLEWQHDVRTQNTHNPRITTARYETCNVIEFQTPSKTNWVRIALRLPAANDTALMACRILFKISPKSPAPFFLQPTIAQRYRETDQLTGLPQTSEKLNIQPDTWFELSGLFATAASDAGHTLDPVFHLPKGCRISIASIDTQRFELTSAPDLMVRSLEQATQVVAPFTLRPFDVTRLPEKMSDTFCFAQDLSICDHRLSGWLLSQPPAHSYDLVVGHSNILTCPTTSVELAKGVQLACGLTQDMAQVLEHSTAQEVTIAPTNTKHAVVCHLPIPAAEQRLQFSAQLTSALSVRGYARDRQHPDRTIHAELRDDANLVLAQATIRPPCSTAPNSTTHSFDIALPDTLLDGQCRRLAVHLVEYPEAEPIALVFSASASGLGVVETIQADRVTGWALSLTQPDETIDVIAQTCGHVIGQAAVDIFRPDVTHTLRTNGFQGFEIALTRALETQELTDLSVQISGSEHPLGRDPDMVLPQLKPPRTKTAHNPLPPLPLRYPGQLEKINTNGVVGWALDTENKNTSLVVSLYIDGLLIESTLADGWRPELKARFGGHGRHGFHISFPPGLDLTQEHQISVRQAETGLNLGHSPRNWAAPAIGTRHGDMLDYNARFGDIRPADLPAAKDTSPSVALIVLNRNGAQHLTNLFSSFAAHNTYPNYRFVIVDHGSTDDSIDICHHWAQKLHIDLRQREINFSFSASNNYGVKVSDAEIVFFLNNDIMVDHCILTPLVRCFDDETTGIVGLKLVSPVETDTGAVRPGFVQHLGVKFALNPNRPLISAYELPEVQAVTSIASHPWEVPAVTGAALAIRRSDFDTVGGFDERYFYGYEDIDFCLSAAQKLGKRILCANHVQAYHIRGATRTVQDQNTRRRYARNQALLRARFGAHVRQHTRKDMVQGGRFWRLNPLRIAFTVNTMEATARQSDFASVFDFGEALSTHLGWEVTYLSPEHWYDLAGFDVVVAMQPDWSPRKIKSSNPNLMYIAWARTGFDRWLKLPWLQQFDVIWAASNKACDAFQSRVSLPVTLMEDATDLKRFKDAAPATDHPERPNDYCFNGEFLRSPRDVSRMLDPAQLPYKFTLYGRGWNDVAWMAPYWKGAPSFGQLPDIYTATKIIVDNASHTNNAWGIVSRQVFDALAAGALVVSNNCLGAQETFGGKLPTFRNQDELYELLHHYLENPKARLAKIKELRNLVVNSHTYHARAKTAADIISPLFSNLRVCIRDLPTGLPIKAPLALSSILQERLRSRFPWVRRLDQQESHRDVEMLGDDVVIHFSTQALGQRPDLETDQVHIRMHLGSGQDISLNEARSYDAVIVAHTGIAAELTAAGIRAVALFETSQAQIACYDISSDSGTFRYSDARLMDQSLNRLIPVLAKLIADLNTNKYDQHIQRMDGDTPQCITARSTQLFYWPGENTIAPSQNAMYQSLPNALSAQLGTIEQAIAQQQDTQTPVIFHLHSTASIFSPEHDISKESLNNFLSKLDKFQNLGGKFIWTAPDISSFQDPRSERHAQLCQDISNRADLVQVCITDIDQTVSPYFQIAPEKLRITPGQDKPNNRHNIQRFIGCDALATLAGQPRIIDVNGRIRHCMVSSPPQPVSGRVAAIVLHYMHIDDTIRCITALLNQTYAAAHIYIVSNDETADAFDFLARQFANCTVIQSPENLGYAGGNNIALSLARTQGFDFMWLVNPDTVAPPEYLSTMVAIADLHPDVSVYGSQILYGDRPETVWFAGGSVTWDNGLESKHCHIGKPTHTVPPTPIPSDYITGASLIFRANLLDDVGYIPEDYFLYFEETHWCLSAKNKGHKIVTFPQAALYHHKRSEEGGAPTPTFLYYYVRNAFLLCTTMRPDQIPQTEARLRRLTQMWLKSVENHVPERLRASQHAVERGFQDGIQGLNGKKPIPYYTGAL